VTAMRLLSLGHVWTAPWKEFSDVVVALDTRFNAASLQHFNAIALQTSINRSYASAF
jgi:hypothetical protein